MNSSLESEMNSLRQLETRLSMVLVDGAVVQVATDDDAIDDILVIFLMVFTNYYYVR